MSMKKGLDTRRPAIIAILFGVLLASAFGAAGCGRQMAQMQENQVKLQAMVAANARQLATLSSQVHAHQGETAEGLAQLEESVNRADAKVASVRDEQSELHRTVLANDRDLNTKIAQLADSQASLREGLSHVADIAQQTNATVNTVARDQATLHQLVQNHNRELADSITALASDVTTLGNEQMALHETVRAHTTTLAESIALVQQDQRHLQAGIDGIEEKTKAANDRLVALATGQDAIQGTLKTNNEMVAARMANLENNHHNLHNNVSALRDTSDRLLADLGTVASEQASLRQVVSDSHAHLVSVAEGHDALHHTVERLEGKTTTLATDLTNRQNAIRAGVDGLQEDANRLGAELEQIASQQRAMESRAKADSEVVLGRLVALAENQHNLQTGIHHVGEQTSQVASEQAALRETIQGHHNVHQERITALADGQRMIQTGLNTMTATTNQGAMTILTMANRQGEMEQGIQAGIAGLATETRQLASGQQALNQALRDRSESLSNQLVYLSQDQQQLRSGLDTLTATTDQVAHNVLAINDAQAGQTQAMQANQQYLAAKLDATVQGQQQISEGLDTITVTTTQTALDIMAVADNQNRQVEATRANQQQLVARLDAAAQGQQHISEGLDTITATTTQTALDVLVVSDSQHRQLEAARANQQQLVTRLDAAAQGQQHISEGLDTIATTTTQTALDVLTVAERQNRQVETAQANQQQLVARLDATTQGQQHIDERLDTIVTNTAQVAREVTTVGDSQVRLQQAFESNREELVQRLAQIAQGQQEWLTRFDTAQANIETMATGIASLEQRVASLQGTLQTSLSDLTALLDASRQQRAQFEETLHSDVQFMGDSLVQLRQTQGNLANQLEQMHSSSESQTEDLLAAIEQLRRRAETDAASAPAQIRSSKAQPEEILLP